MLDKAKKMYQKYDVEILFILKIVIYLIVCCALISVSIRLIKVIFEGMKQIAEMKVYGVETEGEVFLMAGACITFPFFIIGVIVYNVCFKKNISFETFAIIFGIAPFVGAIIFAMIIGIIRLITVYNDVFILLIKEATTVIVLLLIARMINEKLDVITKVNIEQILIGNTVNGKKRCANEEMIRKGFDNNEKNNIKS